MQKASRCRKCCEIRLHCYPNGLCRDCHEQTESRWVRDTITKAWASDLKAETRKVEKEGRSKSAATAVIYSVVLSLLFASTAAATPIRPPVRYAQARPFRTCLDCTKDRLQASFFHSRNSVRALLGLPALRPR